MLAVAKSTATSRSRVILCGALRSNAGVLLCAYVAPQVSHCMIGHNGFRTPTIEAWLIPKRHQDFVNWLNHSLHKKATPQRTMCTQELLFQGRNFVAAHHWKLMTVTPIKRSSTWLLSSSVCSLLDLFYTPNNPFNLKTAIDSIYSVVMKSLGATKPGSMLHDTHRRQISYERRLSCSCSHALEGHRPEQRVRVLFAT